MTLRSLERLAVAGLLAGIGCLLIDALAHRPTRFYRYVPRLRPGRHIWSHIGTLWRGRPALVLGLLLLCVALVLALIVMVTALVRGLTRHDVTSESGAPSE
ncbi:MAG TPA: hypothetical protein VFJ96_10455 [Gemmatimonadaceae bacterium]|jgi:hypothetical protein|nr:hypothetical protein [Gemmatimonadaceae bacterium]